eukprot:5133993-Pyramimonas_sp.AAC.1
MYICACEVSPRSLPSPSCCRMELRVGPARFGHVFCDRCGSAAASDVHQRTAPQHVAFTSTVQTIT